MLTSMEIIKKLEGTNIEVELKAILRRLLFDQKEFANPSANNPAAHGQLYIKIAESQRQATIIFDTINLVTDSKIGYWIDFDKNLCHIVDWASGTETILTSFDSFDPV